MSEPSESFVKLKADQFSLSIVPNPFGQTQPLRVVDVSAAITESTFIIKGFLVVFRAIRQDKEGVSFAFLVEVSVISDTTTPDISSVARIPTVSVVDSSGDWNLVTDGQSIGRCVVRKVP